MSLGVKLPKLNEKQFQAQVKQLAKLLGWRTFHVYDSRRSPEDWPDLSLARKEGEQARLVFLELKVGRRQATPEQQAWIDLLGQVPGVSALVVRPSDWQQLTELLR